MARNELGKLARPARGAGSIPDSSAKIFLPTVGGRTPTFL